MLNENAVKLLNVRGIDTELAVRLGWESIEPAGGEAISIPYFRGGEIQNHKYRTIDPKGPKKFWQDADAAKILWNLDCLTDETLRREPLVITEGEMDAIIAMQCGHQRVVSVPDGAPPERIDDPESAKYSYLGAANFNHVTEIVLATDGDTPGRNLMHDLAIRLGKGRCKWVEYPDGCKDLNEVHYRHGAEGVRKVIREARWFKVVGAGRLSDFAPIPDPVAYPTGMDWLDSHYKLRLGDFAVVTGIPGKGKTTFLNDLACRMADTWGWTVCHASFEQPPRPYHQNAIRQWRLGCPVDEASESQIAAADAWIESQFCFVSPVEDEDEANEFDLHWLLDCVASQVVRYGAKLVVVDPWNEIEHTRLPDENLTDYTGRAIRELKRFTRKYNIHLIVVAHPRKLEPGKDGVLPIPTLYNIADSAHWANKPDVGIVIHRDAEKGLSLCRVSKSRDEQRIGRPGDAWMAFNTFKGRFEAAPRPDEL